MLALLDHYLQDGRGAVRLLFGERTQVDLTYRPTLDRLAATHPRFEVTYVLSKEAASTGRFLDLRRPAKGGVCPDFSPQHSIRSQRWSRS